MNLIHGDFPLKAPFPYFGGKSGAAPEVWSAFGDVKNYVEPFMGSAAMLLNAPPGKRVETANDFDGFVSNFWRAIAHDPDAVAHWADWPVNEVDLFSRHSWLVRQTQDLTDKLHADPDFYDARVAGYWCWGLCSWIGGGWCSGKGPWVHDGNTIVNSRKQLPHLGNAGRGINRATGEMTRSEFIHGWFNDLYDRLRDVRITCGDWSRVVKDSVTTRHGLTGLFLDPPYEKGAMDYGAGGMKQGIAKDVQAWCAANGDNQKLRIVLCGHAGEHDALLEHGWHIRKWNARRGYALTAEAVANSASETLWCSPHCINPQEFITNQPLAPIEQAQAATETVAQMSLLEAV